MQNVKQVLKERFYALFPDCSLYQISIYNNGENTKMFVVLFKDSAGIKHDYLHDNTIKIEDTIEQEDTIRGGVRYNGNTKKTYTLFEGIESDNKNVYAEIHTYKSMEYWDCPF